MPASRGVGESRSQVARCSLLILYTPASQLLESSIAQNVPRSASLCQRLFSRRRAGRGGAWRWDIWDIAAGDGTCRGTRQCEGSGAPQQALGMKQRKLSRLWEHKHTHTLHKRRG